MKAIVIGGGIAGLSTAIALEQVGIRCEVYEAAPVIREVGAGIWMAPNAMQLLDAMGIAQNVVAAGNPLQRTSLADRHLQVMTGIDLKVYKAKFGFATIAIHRGRLQRVLLDALSADQVHAGKRFVRYEEMEGQIRAHFADGTFADGDVLLAADGLRSAVRGQMFPQAKLRFSGQTCWRGVAPFRLPGALQAQSFECWGNRVRLGFSAISEDEVYWYAVALAAEDERDADPQLRKTWLQETFASFAAPIPEMLAATPLDAMIRNDLHDLKRLPTWHQGRVLLLGDAAHAATPNMGQGGCQAVEDAWYLSQILAKDRKPETAFATFGARRRARVDMVVKTSWQIGKFAHFSLPQGLRNWMMRHAPQSAGDKMSTQLFTVEK